MSKRDISLYIVDIFIAIDKCKRYTSKFTSAEEFRWSELEWDATIRELEIIGEATNKLIKEKILEDEKYRKIVDFRNLIIHGYFGIDEDEVYSVVIEKLPEFFNELSSLVDEKNIYIKDAITFAKEENQKSKEVLNFLNTL